MANLFVNIAALKDLNPDAIEIPIPVEWGYPQVKSIKVVAKLPSKFTRTGKPFTWKSGIPICKRVGKPISVPEGWDRDHPKLVDGKWTFFSAETDEPILELVPEIFVEESTCYDSKTKTIFVVKEEWDDLLGNPHYTLKGWCRVPKLSWNICSFSQKAY